MLTSEFPVFFKDKKAKSHRIIFVYVRILACKPDKTKDKG